MPINDGLVTVVIVNWNSGVVLSKCLTHLLNQTHPPRQILIIDNGSQDSSLQSITENEQIKIHRLGKNLGFAAANNFAFSLCNTKYIALLNPDAFPDHEWLECLIAAAISYPEISAFASLQLCDDNPDLLDGAGDSYHVSGLVWRDRHRTSMLPSDKLNRPVFSPCAAAAMYSLQAIIEVGGFDEDFFCYVEDVDLGFRLRLAGHTAILVGNAIVRHIGSASTGGKHSNFCIYQGHRNLVWTYIKNMPGILFWLFLPMHLLLNVVSVVYFSAKGQGRVILHAKIDALNNMTRMLQKRKSIQKRRVVSVFDILQSLNKRFLLLKYKQN